MLLNSGVHMLQEVIWRETWTVGESGIDIQRYEDLSMTKKIDLSPSQSAIELQRQNRYMLNREQLTGLSLSASNL